MEAEFEFNESILNLISMIQKINGIMERIKHHKSTKNVDNFAVQQWTEVKNKLIEESIVLLNSLKSI